MSPLNMMVLLGSKEVLTEREMAVVQTAELLGCTAGKEVTTGRHLFMVCGFGLRAIHLQASGRQVKNICSKIPYTLGMEHCKM